MIEIEKVSKCYGRVVALHQVCLTIQEGEILALLGPNGAGKTTLLKALVGLLHPDSGSIRIRGLDMASQPTLALAEIGFVPQRVAFPRHQTIQEVLAFYARLKDQGQQAVERAMDRVGLENDRFRRIGELSGGMLQRVGLAQAILSEPRVLVLDEPTVGLDPQVSSEFRDLLASLNRDGTTIVLTSHLLGEVERLAHRVAILKEGDLVALDSINRLLTQSGLPSFLWVKPAADPEWVIKQLLTLGIPAERVGPSLKIAGHSDGMAVLEALRDQGVPVESFWTTAPTLEEVFRWVVGKENAR